MPPRKDPDLAAVLGTRIRALRKARGLSQEAVAERAGLQPETVSRAETGTRAPSLPTLVAIADGLECSAAELLTDVTEPAMMRLTGEERRLVELWRHLSTETQAHLGALVQRLVPDYAPVKSPPR